jgi:hypothetical protein
MTQSRSTQVSLVDKQLDSHLIDYILISFYILFIHCFNN